MKRVGVIGLGDMGIGIADNLLKNGFQVSGFDLSVERLGAFEKLGGKPAKDATEVARESDTVFCDGAKRKSGRASGVRL